MDQGPQRKQRPCVVIGTYDSCHQARGQSRMKSTQAGEHHGDDPFELSGGGLSADVFEQSTDLFSYCRSSQLDYNLNIKKHQAACQGIGNNNNNSQTSTSMTKPTKLRFKLSLSQIKGPSGSVRGHKDVVRKSLENIRAVASISSKRNFNSIHFQSFQSASLLSASSSQDAGGQARYSSLAWSPSSLMLQQADELHRAEYLERLVEDELGQCVAYTTTLGVIRRTFEDCKLMRSILNSNLIKYEERDIYLNQEYKKQLRFRCAEAIQVPVLFVDGKQFGGIKEVELMNEEGNLAIQLAQFKMSEAPKHVCYCCGNAKFIACQSCNGSRKSAVHHFKYNSVALRCIKCDRNDGLVDCPVCSAHSNHFDTTRLIIHEHPSEASFRETLKIDDINNNDDSDNNNNNHTIS